MGLVKATIEIDDEIIGDLKNARKRIFDTIDPHYEALEIFTIDDIVRRYDESVAANKQNNSSKLDTCPFCGGEATVMYTENISNDLTLNVDNSRQCSFWVKCSKCQVSQWAHPNIDAAKDAWNKRFGWQG